MVKRARDDFSAPVIRALRSRVAERCSDPGCRVSTSGPATDPMRSASIGKAAHIAAAASGGPRFDAAMSPQERGGVGNGIWLCSDCAAKIDADPDAYPTALLLGWKRNAEALAHSEKGKRQAHPDDARNQLMAALTGAPVPFKQTAISNTHAATERALGALDPRLRVETGYFKGATSYTVHALEPVGFKLRIPSHLAPEWIAGLRGIADHGREARLPASGLKLTGSPLLESMLAGLDLSTAVIRPADPPKPSSLKLTVIDPKSGAEEPFGDLPSALRHGEKSLTFEGEACGGALRVSVTMDRQDPSADPAFTARIDANPWRGLDMRRLPYFGKLRRLIGRLRSGWLVSLEVEAEGFPLARLRGSISGGSEELAAIDAFFQYVDHAIRACEIAGASVLFDPDRTISQEDFERVARVIETIEAATLRGKSALASNPTMTLIAGRRYPSILDAIKDAPPSDVSWVEGRGEEMLILGQPVELPRRIVRLRGVRAILPSHTRPIEAGEEFQVEWEPLDSFELTCRYLKEGESFDPRSAPAEK